MKMKMKMNNDLAIFGCVMTGTACAWPGSPVLSGQLMYVLPQT